MFNSSRAIVAIEEIYRFYGLWASGLELACHKGCAACCTRNVTITGNEGRLILKGVQEKSLQDRLSQSLQVKGRVGRPDMTTNEWAGNCLEGRDVGGQGSDHVLAPCPFLDQGQGCFIYPLRPFACRCFSSSVDCAKSGMAEQPDILMEINTVTLQLIEHLGQGNCWGNMLDVLPILIRENESSQETGGEQRPEKSAQYIRRCRPLPGFLIMPDRQAGVQAYLAGLLAIRTCGTTLDTILQINL